MTNVDYAHFKPFSKVIQLAVSGSPSSVTLTDTAGNFLECNYVIVTVLASIANNGYIVCEPSGISPNIITVGNGASGTCGDVAAPAHPCIFKFGGNYKTSAITLTSYNIGSALNVAVTYGIRQEPNMNKYNYLSEGT